MTKIACFLLAYTILGYGHIIENKQHVGNINTTLSVLTMDENGRFIEESVTVNVKENDVNAIKPSIVQTRVIEERLVDDRFINYRVSKIEMAETGVLFAIGRTNVNKYFIGRITIGGNGKIVYTIILERWHPILDITSVPLIDLDKKNTDKSPGAFSLYWLEKNHNVSVYRALYRLDQDIGDSNTEINNTVYNIQKYHMFSPYIRDARMLFHQKSHNIFIAIAGPHEIMLVKLQQSMRPLPPLQHSSNLCRSQCIFQSKLDYFDARSVIVLLKCAIKKTNEQHSVPKQKNDYMIIDAFNGDTLTSESNDTHYSPRLLHANNYANFQRMYDAILYHINKDGMGMVRLVSALKLNENISIFLYNNGVGWVFISPGDVKKSQFFLRVGRVILLARQVDSILSCNMSSCQQEMDYPKKNKVITLLPNNETEEYEEELIGKTYINFTYLTITQEKNDENNSAGNNDQIIWIPITIGVVSFLLFAVIIILLFIIQKNSKLQ